MVAFSVKRKVNEFGIPFDGVSVEIFPDIFGFPYFMVGGVFAILAKVGITMDFPRSFTNELHDINFSAAWPPDLWDVVTKCPNGRPDSLTLRQLGTYFDFTKFPRSQTLGLETG